MDQNRESPGGTGRVDRSAISPSGTIGSIGTIGSSGTIGSTGTCST